MASFHGIAELSAPMNECTVDLKDVMFKGKDSLLACLFLDTSPKTHTFCRIETHRLNALDCLSASQDLRFMTSETEAGMLGSPSHLLR